jgi:hypothetical protein
VAEGAEEDQVGKVPGFARVMPLHLDCHVHHVHHVHLDCHDIHHGLRHGLRQVIL